jgi:DNA-binding Xre family transcriptional regulator
VAGWGALGASLRAGVPGLRAAVGAHVDEVRAGSNISKAELARRVGVKPSVISRLLDGKGRNVQLDTVADVADALDVYIEMRVRPQPKSKRARHAPIEVLAA